MVEISVKTSMSQVSRADIGPSCIQEWTLKIFIDLFRERQHF